jgi:two-component system sensor histidine kinase RpfC
MRPSVVDRSAQGIAQVVSAAAAGIPFEYVLVAERNLDMDPIAFVRAIKSDPTIHHTRVILIAEGREDADAIARSGYSAVLPSPVDRTLLFSALHLSRPDAAPGDSTVADIIRKYRERQAGGRKLRVLVAEDNRTNQMVIAKILERAGHEVVLAADGERAIEELKSHTFDITLMDLHMPVMGGIEAAKLFRFMHRSPPRMPIVALTADATPEARAECMDAGMDACLTKPVDTRELFELFDRLVPGSAPQPRGAEDAAPKDARRAGDADREESVDPRVLRELSELGGGGDFVVRLVWTFLKGAREKVRELDRAVSEGDVEGARKVAHALKGNSGQIGAYALMRACDRFSGISAAELERNGRTYCEEVREEFARARASLNRQMEGRDSAVS